MNPDLDKQLCEKYPSIFRDRHGNMRETAMCWGFECGDGWYKLLDKLCAKIQVMCDLTGMTVWAAQVKEKFGTLRFYTSVQVMDDSIPREAFDIVDDIIASAERESAHTCELCGEYGKLYTDGWCEVRCKAHSKGAAGDSDE